MVGRYPAPVARARALSSARPFAVCLCLQGENCHYFKTYREEDRSRQRTTVCVLTSKAAAAERLSDRNCSGEFGRCAGMASAAALLALRAHLAKSDYPHKFERSSDVSKFIEECYPSLLVEVVPRSESDPKGRLTPGHDQWIIVTSARFVHLFDSSIGPVRPARIVFKPDGKHTFEVLMTVVSSGSWYDSQPPHKEISSILDTLLENSGYVLCPGIKSYESTFSDHIRFTPKKLRVWKNPVRYDSDECSLWHKPNNMRCSPDDDLFDVCTSCKNLKNQLNAIKKRAIEASPGHKEKWVDTSSCRPFKYLSPASQTECISRNRTDRKKLRKALMKYDLDVDVESEQDAELQQLVTTIDEKGQSELENIFAEAGECGEELRTTWEKDVTLRKQFFQDQARNSKCIVYV